MTATPRKSQSRIPTHEAKRVINPPDEWIRADGAFEAIIESDFFEAAQRIVSQRCRRFTDSEMLERLAGLHQQTGWLSGLIIDEAEDMPSSSVYRHRFGSLVRAYQLIGYENKALPGNQVLAIRRIIEIRNTSGKGMRGRGSSTRRDGLRSRERLAASVAETCDDTFCRARSPRSGPGEPL